MEGFAEQFAGRLGEDAGDYDSDALSFVAGHDEEDVA